MMINKILSNDVFWKVVLLLLSLFNIYITKFFSCFLKSYLKNILDEGESLESYNTLRYFTLLFLNVLISLLFKKDYNKDIIISCIVIMVIAVIINIIINIINSETWYRIRSSDEFIITIFLCTFGIFSTIIPKITFNQIDFNNVEFNQMFFDYIIIVIFISYVDFILYYGLFVLKSIENSDIRIKYKGDELCIYKKLNNGYLLCGKEKHIRDASNIIRINIKDILENNEEYKIYYLKNHKMEDKNNTQPCGMSKEDEIGEVASDEGSV
ncbi:hypothetical protein [Lachnospira multipara]|uniref:hypothetical protein n=1 Tax=Lachnospira multipara TaxID=28051 RepID=UPI000420CA97|nr:hypothetical protein [Lachnospira multipara]